MGLTAPVADLLAFEAVYRPLYGDIAVLGRQTTYVTERHLDWLFKRYKLQRVAGAEVEIDSVTQYAVKHSGESELKLITDSSFFRLLGAESYSSLDVSSYEGANIICDMSQPIQSELYSRFDFIYDGSSLDNIFNPAQALSNLSLMLRPGGRLMILEHGTMFAGAYTAFSPGWFFDFFTANRYCDCKVYVARFRDEHTLRFGPWPLRLYNWYGEKGGITPQNNDGDQLILIVIAEKDDKSTDSVLPVQFPYRDRAYQESIFIDNVERILRSGRPAFFPEFGEKTLLESKTYVACRKLSADAPF